MHIERMHRTLKYLYMGGKHVKRLDLGIHAIMQFVRDKLLDRLITINKGKLSRKLKDLGNCHVSSEKLSFEMILPDETGWQVVSGSSPQKYFVNRIKTECQCNLTCSDCQNVCLHQYTCTCIDASVKWNMCKHIHLMCRYLQSKSIAIESTEAQNPDV
ncbi:hypothetical protein NQ315_005659 [Exocentrus adspersus]|uniref:SWIM-type domain-containing protein n=1 Tax=Exocentrus adspersus TaxID=1586481 RepID=A0AAV8V6Y1_9CUCU|nr:hypothetical protein NQ315_005659 [Exocentrus adspersus]